jgi:putative MFS transporter
MSSATQVTPAQIAARIERLPFSPWHVKLRVIMGVATFFDAFDALAIAYVLPALIPLWKLAPGQVGLLISIGFAGQLVGAILFGWLAEKQGRVRIAAWTIGIFSVFSLVCAFSWNLPSMLVFRFFQGLGLGGQVPIAAAYINEIAKAEGRGRFFQL